MVYEGITITLVVLGLGAILWSYYDFKTIPIKAKEEFKNKNNEYYEEYGARIDELNQKILELNEYGGFLKSELDKKHKELLFLYQLIHEKTLEIKENKENNYISYNSDSEEDLPLHVKADNIINNTTFEQDVTDVHQVSFNQMILELSEKGYSIKEIAQLLEVGQGEVKLVLDLYEWGVNMKKESKILIRGIGIGVIVTSLLFYCILTFTVPKSITLSNEEIIERAKGLGMIFITELQDNQKPEDLTIPESNTEENTESN